MTRFRKPKRASTIAIDEGRVSRHIVPLIGKLPARDLTRVIVQHMADGIAAKKTRRVFRDQSARESHRTRWRRNGSACGRTAWRYLVVGRKAGFVSGANPSTRHRYASRRGEGPRSFSQRAHGARRGTARAGAVESSCDCRHPLNRFDWRAAGGNLCTSLARDR